MRTQTAFKYLPKEDQEIIRNRYRIRWHTNVWTEPNGLDRYRVVYAQPRLWTIILIPFMVLWDIIAAIIETVKEIPENLKGYFEPYRLFSYRTTEITREDL